MLGTGRSRPPGPIPRIRRAPRAPGGPARLCRRDELGPDALPLPGGLDDDPVQVVRAARARRRTPAGVASELVARVAAQEAVVVVAGEALVEQLHGDRDLFRLEHAGGAGEPLKLGALRAVDGAERAAHGPRWHPARRGAPPPRPAAPAPRSPSPSLSPCAPGRRRRSGRGSD